MGLRHRCGRLILLIVDPWGELGRDDRTATMATHEKKRCYKGWPFSHRNIWVGFVEDYTQGGSATGVWLK